MSAAADQGAAAGLVPLAGHWGTGAFEAGFAFQKKNFAFFNNTFLHGIPSGTQVIEG